MDINRCVLMINGIAQNKLNKVYAESMIEKYSVEEKKQKIEELEKIGYSYNNGIHTLVKLNTIIPYDFILYCLLVEDLNIERKE